jgi:hypothetical protein
MNLRKSITRIAAGAALATLLMALPVQAASTASTVGAAADENLSRIERILGDVEKAKEVLTGKPGTASTDTAKAQEVLRVREAELEKARIDAMSAASGLPREKVAALRARGKSWGDISGELGVSPRVVGLGSGKDGGRDDNDRGKGHGKKKGWKHGMPPGQAKKHGYDD